MADLPKGQGVFMPPFKSWLASNIPAVYDNTMTYYEELCALIKYLETQVVPALNHNAAAVTTISKALEQLKQYVDQYFDNLDIQEEINNKLDKMVEDGTLTEIIGNYVDAYVAETNERLGIVEGEVTTLNTNVNNLQNSANGIVGIQVVGTDHYIFYSPDCINFSFVHKLPAGVGNDASALYEINGVFYLMGNNKYWYTTDFVTWTDGGNIKDSYAYQRIWGATIYYDEDNELVYIYSSYQYSNDTHASAFGGTTYYFKIGYQTATINENGSFTIDQTIHDLIYEVGESYMDSYVAKDPFLGYIIAYKNEFTAKVKVAIMNSLTSVSTTEATCIGYGIEAPQLLTDEKGTICFVDGYANTNSAKTGISNLPNIRGNVYRVSNSGTLYQENKTGLTPLKMPVSYHHMGIMRCSDKALYLIEQLGVKPTLNSTCSDFKIVDGLQTVSLSSVSNPTLINFPNIQYLIPATSKTVTIKPEYIGIPFRIYAFKGAVITWSNDSNIQSACKNATYTVTHDQLIEFYPSTNDMITGTWIPIDRD